MKQDILIAASLVTLSVAVLFAIIAAVARAVREEPPMPEPATGLPSGCGW
jgi:hypothetical protein